MCIILKINLVHQYNETLLNLRFHSADQRIQRMSLFFSCTLPARKRKTCSVVSLNLESLGIEGMGICSFPQEGSTHINRALEEGIFSNIIVGLWKKRFFLS